MIIDLDKNTGIKRSLELGKLPPKTLDTTFNKDLMVEGQSVYVKEQDSIAEYIKFGNTIYKRNYEVFRTHKDSQNNWHPQIFTIGFNYSTTAGNDVFLPLNGSLTESTGAQNEFHSMIAPYNGRMSYFAFRSEEAFSSANYVMKLLYSTDGTELPGTVQFTTGTVSLNIADDITHIYKEKNLKEHTYIPKNSAFAVKFDPSVDVNDTIVTMIIEWDLNS
tara:strand:+ start:1169 stop:1825 length:657 start_codon:yes stop_codon:yes gene_type:complete